MKTEQYESASSLAEKIRREIEEDGLGKLNIFVFDSIDSTNSEAKRYAKAATDKSPAVFIARSQSCGRGRMGRSFVSLKDAGLFISFLFYPEKSAKNALSITAHAAVKAARAIENVSGLYTQIKWVNDIYVGEKKLGGILTEGEIDADGNLLFAICGIGINIKDLPLGEELDKIATSIEGEIGSAPPSHTLARELILEFFSEQGDIMDEYRSRSAFIGKKITVSRIGGEQFEAVAIGISDTGALVIEKDGEREELISAEITIRKKN